MAVVHDLGRYPPLQKLTDNWQKIRDEVARLRTDTLLPIDRENKTHQQVHDEIVRGGKQGWVRAWGPTKDRWLNYGLMFRDDVVFDGIGVPFTASLLKHIRGVKVGALSLFRPGACLPVHDHPELGAEKLLTFHLPLLTDTPTHSFLSTDGQFVPERAGSGFVFDGAKPHFAFNCSNATRVILYLEFSPELLRWVA